jgi:hypothetical protein
MPKSRFEDALLMLFLRAEAEGRRDMAERLMQALEAFYAGPDAEAGPPPAGDDAHGPAPDRRRPPEAPDEPPRWSGAAGRSGCPTE